MRVVVGGRQVGKTTKLVQQIIAENGYDLSETFYFTPHRPNHVEQIMADLGVTALPVFVNPVSVVDRREKLHGHSDWPVYVDDAETILLHICGERPQAITMTAEEVDVLHAP
mgnify:CR=1 FL=1